VKEEITLHENNSFLLDAPSASVCSLVSCKLRPVFPSSSASL